MAENTDTYGQLLRQAGAKLSNANIEGPLRDARRLMELAAGISPAQLIADEDSTPSFNIIEKFENYIKRRIQGEPVSRISQRREFWSLEFEISTDVLDPRPDTETLVELVLSQWRENYTNVLDLGTGSGCILLSILSERFKAKGVGLDQSEAALDIAKKNASKLKLGERASFLQSDWFSALSNEQHFDVIVSNPPYIPSGDIAHLDKDVRDYDPTSALDGGIDGYDDYRRIIDNAKTYLNENGLIAFEVGINQSEKVCDLLQNMKFEHINFRKDLSGIKRCVYARAPRV